MWIVYLYRRVSPLYTIDSKWQCRNYYHATLVIKYKLSLLSTSSPSPYVAYAVFLTFLFFIYSLLISLMCEKMVSSGHNSLSPASSSHTLMKSKENRNRKEKWGTQKKHSYVRMHFMTVDTICYCNTISDSMNQVWGTHHMAHMVMGMS